MNFLPLDAEGKYETQKEDFFKGDFTKTMKSPD